MAASNHGRAGSVADHQHLVRNPARAKLGDGRGKRLEALFHHDPAEEHDQQLVVGNAVRAPPLGVAPPGVELVAVDSAGPQGDVLAHALGAQDGGGQFGGRDDRVAASVETAQHRPDDRLEPVKPVILQIGLEAGVDRGHHRHAVGPRPGHGAMGDDVGAGDVDDIGAERLEVGLRSAGEARRDSIFPSPRDREARHVDQVAGRRKGGVLAHRRIDAHLGAAAEQIADQPVQRLVGAVADIIVIAGEQGNAKVGRLHGGPAITGARPKSKA